MRTYEYKVVLKEMPFALKDKKFAETARELEREMNQLGAEGWEFVQWKNSMLLFKRDVEQTGSSWRSNSQI